MYVNNIEAVKSVVIHEDPVLMSRQATPKTRAKRNRQMEGKNEQTKKGRKQVNQDICYIYMFFLYD
jgi:hypothetical protein